MHIVNGWWILLSNESFSSNMSVFKSLFFPLKLPSSGWKAEELVTSSHFNTLSSSCPVPKKKCRNLKKVKISALSISGVSVALCKEVKFILAFHTKSQFTDITFPPIPIHCQRGKFRYILCVVRYYKISKILTNMLCVEWFFFFKIPFIPVPSSLSRMFLSPRKDDIANGRDKHFPCFQFINSLFRKMPKDYSVWIIHGREKLWKHVKDSGIHRCNKCSLVWNGGKIEEKWKMSRWCGSLRKAHPVF